MRTQPTYDLKQIKKAFKNTEHIIMTYSARQTQYLLGFSDQDVIDTIHELTEHDFYKSMPPSNAIFSDWQDVYKPIVKAKKLYIKFQLNNKKFIIISFKEK